MGDAILVFFGDPNSEGVERDAQNCLEMAMAMRQQMKILRERWVKWVIHHCIFVWGFLQGIVT